MAAEELNMEKLQDLKRQVESLGVDEKQRNKLTTEKWRRMREAEERKVSSPGRGTKNSAEAEAEERRLAAQAEKPRIAAEERKVSSPGRETENSG